MSFVVSLKDYKYKYVIKQNGNFSLKSNFKEHTFITNSFEEILENFNQDKPLCFHFERFPV